MYNNGEIYLNNSAPILDGGYVVKKENKFKTFFTKYKIPFIALCAVVVIGLGFLIFNLLFPQNSELVVLVAPETARIEIDGKLYKNGVYNLSAGTHFAKISADGFSYTELNFETEGGEPFLLDEALDEIDGTYTDADYEILSLIAESEETVAKVNDRVRAKTFFNRLPITNAEYAAKISNASGSENCSKNSLCLLVESEADLSEEKIASLIRSYDYDPNDYEIISVKKEDEE